MLVNNFFDIDFYKSVMSEPDKFEFKEGCSLREVMNDLPLSSSMNIIVKINGIAVSFDNLDSVFPKNNDEVVIANVPRGDSSAAQKLGIGFILNPVAMIANIGLVAGYALYKLYTADEPDVNDSAKSKSIPSITGIRNEEKRYQPLSLILGKRVVAPAFAALPYTEIVGEDEYFNMLFSVGYGPLNIEDVKIGDTLLSNYPSDEYEIAILDHFNNRNINRVKRLWPVSVVQNGLDYLLTKSGGAIEYKVETLPGVGSEYTNASQDFFFPKGVYSVDDDGDFHWRRVGVAHELDVDGSWCRVMTVQFVSGSGTNFSVKDYQAYKGSDGDVRCNWTVGGSRASAVIPSGYIVSENDNGSVIVVEDHPDLSSIELPASFTMSGNSAKQRRYALKYDVPTGASGLVRTAKMFPTDTPDSSKTQDDVNWVNIRSIKEETLDEFKDALDLSDNDSVKPVIIAMRMKATDNFNSMINNFNVKATMVVPTAYNINWKDWEVASLKVSENPADAFRWVLQGPCNVANIDTSRIDTVCLNEWRNFCADQGDKESFRITSEIDSEQTLFATLSSIAKSGRATFSFNDSKYGVVINKDRPLPVQVFTPKNSWGFTSTRAYPEKTDGIKVEFTNELADYQEDEIVYYDSRVPESERTGKFSSISMKNIPSAKLAARHGRWTLFERSLRREIYTLSTDIEGLVAKRGDKVLIQNDIIDVGRGAGRIKWVSQDRTQFKVDEISELDTTVLATLDSIKIFLDSSIKLDAEGIVNVPTESMGVIFRSKIGDISEVIVCKYSGDGLWEAPNGIPYSTGVGDFMTYGDHENETLECIVDAVDYKEDYACDLTLKNYAPELFTYDGDEVPDYTTGLNERPEFKVPEAPVLLDDYSFNPSTSQLNINIDYEFSYDFTIRSIILYERHFGKNETIEDLGNWTMENAITEGNRNFVVSNVRRGETYEFRSRIINIDGVSSNYSNVISTGEISTVIPPADVSTIDLDVDSTGVTLTWSAVLDPDFSYYEIRRVDNGIETVIGTSVSETFFVGVTENTSFRVYAKTKYGVYSENSPTTDLLISDLGVVSNLKATVNFGSISLDWDQPTNSIYPITYYELRRVLPTREIDWETAEVIGKVSGSFSLVAEKTSGVYHYMIQATDEAGRKSQIATVRAVVDRAGDFVLLVDQNLDLSDTTDVTSENVAINGTLIAPVDESRTFTDRINRISSEDTSGSVPPNQVTVNDKINAGWTRFTQPLPLGDNDFVNPSSGTSPCYYERVVDLFDGYIDSDGSNLIGGTRVSVGIDSEEIEPGVVMTTYLSSSADGIVWDDGIEGTENFFQNFRYVRVRLFFDTDTSRKAQMQINEINLRLDVQKKTEEGEATINAQPVTGETIVQLTREFIDVESVVITVEGGNSANYYAVSLFSDVPNPDEFRFKVFNSNGVLVTDTSVLVSYIVRGV